MADLVSSAHIDCICKFEKLLAETQSISPYYQGQVDSKTIRILLERYQLWAGNLGAGHSGRNYELSLDYRLREASSLKSDMIELLERLSGYLVRLIQLLSGERIAFEQQEALFDNASQFSSSPPRDHEFSDQQSIDSSSTDDSEVIALRAELEARLGVSAMISGTNAQDQIEDEPTEAAEREVPSLLRSIDLLLNHLYSLPIRRPAPMNRLSGHDGTSLLNKYIAPFDVDHVRNLIRNLYPDVDENIVAIKRLGAMNTQRRCILEYRKKHHERLKGKEPIFEDIVQAPSTSTISMFEHEIAPAATGSSRSGPTKTHQTKATTYESSIQREKLPPPKTLPAPSIVSRVTSRTAKNVPVDVPQQPVEEHPGSGYVCPYCFILTQRMTEEKWEEHVMRDLQPYVCTYTQCNLGEHFFDDKDAWYVHEARYHRCFWSCNVTEHGVYSLGEEFIDHLKTEHIHGITLESLDRAGEAFRKPPRERSGKCHLCDEHSDDLKTHVGRHLQRIALFILFQNEDKDDSDADLMDIDSQKAVRPQSAVSEGFVLAARDPREQAEHREAMMGALDFAEMDSRRLTIKRSYPQTSRWILHEPHYLDWIDPFKVEDHHGLLWIKGKPASGKSTIMKFLYEQVKSEKRPGIDTLVISFFFNAGGVDLERSATGMYRSLLFQLLSQAADFQVLLDDINPSTTFDRGDLPLLRELFRQVLDRVSNRQMICFVDALDECPEEEARDMMDSFEQYCAHAWAIGSRLLICLSSRHLPHISVGTGLQFPLEMGDGLNKDISTYVNAELKIGSSRLAQSLKEHICTRSNGNFLWAVLMVQMSRMEFDRGRVHSLQRKLNDLPRDFDELFRNMLPRDSQDLLNLVLVIQWVLYARRPLSQAELYFALMSEPGFVGTEVRHEKHISERDMHRYILSCSKGFVEFTEGSNPTAQLIHHSVREFLLRPETLIDPWPGLHALNPENSHETLRDACEKQCDYIFHAYDIQQLPSGGELCDLFPFLMYGVREVLYHAEEAQVLGRSQVAFLRNFKWSNWVTLWNIFETIPSRQMENMGTDPGNTAIMGALIKLEVPQLQQTWAAWSVRQ